MAPPDVLKYRTQAFFLFSPGEGERKLGSHILTFRSQKKRAMAGESLLGIPTLLVCKCGDKGTRALWGFPPHTFSYLPPPTLPDHRQIFVVISEGGN